MGLLVRVVVLLVGLTLIGLSTLYIVAAVAGGTDLGGATAWILAAACGVPGVAAIWWLVSRRR